MKKATIKVEMYRLFPDDMSDEEISTTSYLVTCGILEMYLNSHSANVVDVKVETVEKVDEEETTTD